MTGLLAPPGHAFIAAGESHIGEVGGRLKTVSVEFIRPADTTPAYTAGDAVSNSTTATTLMAFDIARVAGGSGYITKIRLSTNLKSISPRFRLHFFNAADPTIAADNAPYKEVYADNAKRLGWYDLPAMTTAADTTNSDCSRAVDMTARIPYICAAGSTVIYAGLETLDGFTQASAQKFNLTLNADNN